MAYPIFAAGQKITAAMLQALQPSFVDQGDDLTVNDSTTLTDTSIVVSVEAGAQYKYRLLASYTSSTTADATFAWDVPTGGTMKRWTWGAGLGGTGGAGDYSSVSFRRPDATTEVNVGGGTTSTTFSYHEEGVFIGGTADGDFTLQFAQATADASDTVLTASTMCEYQRIE